ncbi:MAG: DUF1343 domain-containing protein [Candidatus Glassbacteria bacterium]|nr:DUF1343 domain-containing protein [Candidatus Glassbacteria bacterium]
MSEFGRHITAWLVLLMAAWAASACSATAESESAPARNKVVMTGLDILVKDEFAQFAGLRVGAVTNHTGVDSRGRPLYRLLSAEPDVELAAVFAPEHGLEGVLEGEYESAKAGGSGLTVHSLYGLERKPRREWLDGLDALVFDIQDIGTRFYTYISTMALCMQAAAENGITFYVLDRPNPVGGLSVEGPVLEESLRGDFIAYYPIPVRHGMTVGELARLFNDEFGIGADLHVVRMDGWRRGMYYDRTGLAWIDPSPNMRSLSAAILYPGLGISEATNLSVGRGTDIPFELYGAPYVDGVALAARLNSAGLAGVSFRDTTFTPESHVFPGRACGGVRAVLTDREAFNSVEAGLHLLNALERLYPDKFDLERIDRWIGRRDVKRQLEDGVPVERIIAAWQDELERFKQTRAKYLIYPE